MINFKKFRFQILIKIYILIKNSGEKKQIQIIFTFLIIKKFDLFKNLKNQSNIKILIKNLKYKRLKIQNK